MESLDAGLARYSRRRRAQLGYYQLVTRWLTPFFQSDSRFLGAVRDATFGLANLMPFAEGQMLRTLAGIKTGVFSQLDPGEWSERYATGSRRRVMSGVPSRT